MTEVSVNREQVNEVLRLLNGIQNEANTALRRSINNTLSGTKTAVSKGIGQTITLKAKEIKSYIRVKRAKNSELSGRVILSGVLIPAIKFRNRQVRNGVSLKIWKQDRPVKLRHSFYAEMASGHRGIFYRKQLSTGVYAGRLPIIEQFGPNITTAYEKTPGLANRVEREAADRLLEQINNQVNFILNIENG